MLTLQNQIKWCSRLQWWLGGAMLLLWAAFLLLGYRPITRRQATLEQQIAMLQSELSTSSSKAGALPQVAGEVKIQRLKLDGANRLPKQNDLAQFIRDITQLSQQSSLKKFQYKPEPRQRGQLFCQLPVKLTFEGDFVNVFSFLRQTETMQRLTRTRSIALSTKDRNDHSGGGNGNVKAEVSMSIYFSPDE